MKWPRENTQDACQDCGCISKISVKKGTVYYYPCFYCYKKKAASDGAKYRIKHRAKLSVRGNYAERILAQCAYADKRKGLIE